MFTIIYLQCVDSNILWEPHKFGKKADGAALRKLSLKKYLKKP